MKRVIALLLVVMICFGLFSIAASAAELPFSDMAPNAYYVPAVLWAVENQITNGINDSEFGPDNICTRGQVVTFLWRAAGSPEPESATNPFIDVNVSNFYYKAVLWAVENGITTGTSQTTFSPDNQCTRAQVATFLWREKGEPDSDAVNSFYDVSSGAFYYDAVLWAVENGVTNGMGEGRFAPDAPCTRGQIVTFLYRASSIQENVLILPELPSAHSYTYIIGSDLIHQSASFRVDEIDYSFRDHSDGTVDLSIKLSGNCWYVHTDGRFVELRCTISNGEKTYTKTASFAAYGYESFNGSVYFYDLEPGEYTLTLKSVSK